MLANIRITGSRDGAPSAKGIGGAHTVVYVHGIGNKPIASVLKCQWDNALFGTDLGERSRMAYWVNRSYYPVPLSVTCASGDFVRIDDDEASTKAIVAIARGEDGSDEEVLEREVRALSSGDAATTEWLRRLGQRLVDGVQAADSQAGREATLVGAVTAKLLPLPLFLRRRFATQLTRAFLRDVNDFLFDEDRREFMERRLLDRLAPGGGPFVVIAHSQGSLIAYDVLRRLNPREVQVPLFVTIGSPLGIQEVQDMMRDEDGELRAPACVGRWLNIADRLDAIALDPTLRNDVVGGEIDDLARLGLNPDSPRHPHSATGYLATTEVRTAVRSVVGAAFAQSIVPFAIAKDLVTDMEDGAPEERHLALIQLGGDGRGNSSLSRTTDTVAIGVEEVIRQIVSANKTDFEEVELDRLRNFISARLTRSELEVLRSRFADLAIEGIWRNASKRALIAQSTYTVQARPANIGYGAHGKDICWAVLDTGLRADHPHFMQYNNVVAQWDCTRPGPPLRIQPGQPRFSDLDGHGHGTHVAGIIAGELKVGDIRYSGMAPQASLCGFKVLDDAGNGRDAWIIKAVDTIFELNESAGRLVIHGVNLSLGGAFDPSVFGCGHTPLCQELRRLWRQGVVICLAAGNEGYAILAASGGDIQANIDLSIGDPANLDEAIAVGSVHKTNPHTYGISHFSSRGPTADGRQKPDVVAPGERIISARHDWPSATTPEERYVEMSGTSMATPHVSGILAAFLSLRREFIGYPERVKETMIRSCVDLRRDPNMQGAGLPNLVKMLVSN